QGLFFPEQAPERLPRYLETLLRSPDAEQLQATAQQSFDDFEVFCAQGTLPRLVDAFESLDAWFLAAMKSALMLALREFERHGPEVRARGSLRVRRACLAMAGVVRKYLRRAAQRTPQREPWRPSSPASPASEPPAAMTRLHTGTYWVLEEDARQKLAVLRRTPVAAASLEELSQENERVLRCLRIDHRRYGLVVDTRQARMRNDSGFEDAMAKLRHELAGHFLRTAVLLESSIGELQVSRIERDERRQSIATRSESTAFKFAQGGS
ncbi:MAG TPA: hypothetical protein VI299_20420, partial [Polyangiales bacterium]